MILPIMQIQYTVGQWASGKTASAVFPNRKKNLYPIISKQLRYFSNQFQTGRIEYE